MAGSWIEIDRERLLGNVAVFRSRLGDDAHLMAVVKANAYGHGLELVAPEIQDHVDWFGVDSFDEAMRLPAERRPVLILGHLRPGEAEDIVEHGFRQVLFRRDTAEALAKAALARGKRALVHLKIETGLHRLGVSVDELPAFAERVAKLGGVHVEGIYTHFAEVEDPTSTFHEEQLSKLQAAAAICEEHGLTPSIVHASPTAGALLHGARGLARVGIGVYGVWPSAETRAASEVEGLRPVLSWKCRIAQTKIVPAGASVGYDRTYRASGAREIAVLPVGYSDGFDRSLTERGAVLVRGKRARVVGRVAMNMTMVDVTGIGAENDDEVVLIGEQGTDAITAEDVASWSDTIAYEVLARLSRGLPRRISR